MSKYQLGQYKGTISEIGIYTYKKFDAETGQDVEKEHVTFRAELKTHINPKTNEEMPVPEGTFSPEISHYLTGKNIEGKGFEFTMKYLAALAGDDYTLELFNDGSLIGKEITVSATPDNSPGAKYPIKFSLFMGYGPPKKREDTTRSGKDAFRRLSALFPNTKKTSTPAAPVSAVEKDSFV